MDKKRIRNKTKNKNWPISVRDIFKERKQKGIYTNL